jgi:hypothetical protein
MSERTSTQIAKLKQSSHNESVKQWERTNNYPPRMINFGYHHINKVWRLTVHVAAGHAKLYICEAILENKDGELLLDLAFEASETYNCPIQIVINNTNGKMY